MFFFLFSWGTSFTQAMDLKEEKWRQRRCWMLLRIIAMFIIRSAIVLDEIAHLLVDRHHGHHLANLDDLHGLHYHRDSCFVDHRRRHRHLDLHHLRVHHHLGHDRVVVTGALNVMVFRWHPLWPGQGRPRVTEGIWLYYHGCNTRESSRNDHHPSEKEHVLRWRISALVVNKNAYSRRANHIT